MAQRPDFSLLSNLSELQDFNFQKNEYIQFIDGDRHFSNKQVFDLSNSIACAIRSLNIPIQSKIAMCSKLSVEAFSILPAIWNAGCTAVSIHSKLAGVQIVDIIQITQAEVLFIDASKWDSIRVELETITTLKKIIIIDGERPNCVSLKSILKPNQKRLKSSAKPLDASLILFSSGSTGKPKGIILTHQMMCSEVEKFFLEKEKHKDPNYLFMYTEPCRVLFNTPLGHVAGTMALTTNLASGNTYILQDVFDVADMFKLIEKHSAEALFFGPPTVYVAIAAFPEIEKFNLSSMRYWSTGGAPISYDKIQQLKKRLPGMFAYVYGLTESSGISSITDFDENYVLDSVGKAFPGLEFAIYSLDGEKLPPGEMGEVCIRGNTISPGYLGLEEETKKTFKNGWLFTGDLGKLDNDGNLFLNGRAKHLIRQAGVNVFPRTIELAIEKIAEVKECAVVGMTDEVLGERVVAYVVANEGSGLSSAKVRDVCQKNLARYEVPRQIIFIDKMPRTNSNKIDLPLLKKGYRTDNQQNSPNVFAFELERRNQLISNLKKIASQMNIVIEDEDAPLMQSGFDSLAAVEFSLNISEFINEKIPETLIFNYPTLNSITDYLLKSKADEQLMEHVEVTNNNDDDAVAIIGVSCRLPGEIDSLDNMWEKLKHHVNCLIDIPKSRWNCDELLADSPTPEGKIAQAKGGFLHAVGSHDPQFFDLSPREAKAMDPQQRIIQLMAWEAVENSLIKPKELSQQTTGVYIGISSYDFCHLGFGSGRSRPDYSVGFLPPFISGRLSHIFNLNGPSMVLDTACSSSLVALHLAAQAIRTGDCDMALAGGISVMTVPVYSQIMSMMGVLAPDGACKTFDSSANGTVRSEGGGMLLLKKLSVAQKDGNNILGVIRGSAISHDAKSTGVAAPNGASQIKVIKTALKNARLKPDDISYVEAHGTGTVLGDAIELNSIHEAYQTTKTRYYPMYVGSIKTNIGHTEAAAGVAGVIKVLASFKNSKIPAHLHFKNPNTNFDWMRSSVQIPEFQINWTGKKIAGINSFGVSGTNAHMIIEEPPARPLTKTNVQNAVKERTHHILCLSAKSENSLSLIANKYIALLDNNPEVDLANICFTANTRRNHFPIRKALVFNKISELRRKLQEVADGKDKGHFTKKPNKLAFLYTGQGAIAANMGKDLIESNSVFSNSIKSSDHILESLGGITYAEMTFSSDSASKLLEVEYSQSAMLSLQIALTDMLNSWGIYPTHILGHSGGEFAATYAAGIYSASDSYRLSTQRSYLMSKLSKTHSLLTVFASAVEIEKVLKEGKFQFDIAAFNAPECNTIVGLKKDLEMLIPYFEKKGIRIKILESAARGIGFHSSWVDPILKSYIDFCSQFSASQPTCKYFSSYLGTSVSNKAVFDSNYWANLTRQPVKYSSALSEMIAEGVSTFVELGPHSVLAAFGPMNSFDKNQKWQSLLRNDDFNWKVVLSVLKSLYESGYEVDWEAFDRDHHRSVIEIPLYQFDYIDCGLHPYGENVQTDLAKLNSEVIRPFEKEAPSFSMPLAKVSTNSSGNLGIALVQSISEVTGKSVQIIQPDMKLVELGIDSMKFIEIMMDLEDRLKTKFDLSRIDLNPNSKVSQVEVTLEKIFNASVDSKTEQSLIESSIKPNQKENSESIYLKNLSLKSTDQSHHKFDFHFNAVIKDITGQSVEKVGLEAKLRELNIDSMKFIQLVLDLEEKMNIKIDFNKLNLNNNPTLREFKNAVLELSGFKLTLTLVPDVSIKANWSPQKTRNSLAKMQLFCFHHLGGAASLFQNWPSHLDSSIELVPIQLPGREERLSEKPYNNFQSLLNDLEVFLIATIDKPFALFGHSMGGAIAAILTQRLAAKGFINTHLFVSGFRAPLTIKKEDRIYNSPITESNIGNYVEIPESLSKHTDFMTMIIARLEMDREVVNTIQFPEVFNLNVPLTVFAGDADKLAPEFAVKEWKSHTHSPDFECIVFKGGHMFINQNETQLVQMISGKLLQHISQIDLRLKKA